MACGQITMLIGDCDGMICFLAATIDRYKGPDFQYSVVNDQDCVFRQLVRIAAFDAENPIAPLGIMSRVHWRYLRSAGKLCCFEGGTDEFGKFLAFGRRQHSPRRRRRVVHTEPSTAARG